MKGEMYKKGTHMQKAFKKVKYVQKMLYQRENW